MTVKKIVKPLLIIQVLFLLILIYGCNKDKQASIVLPQYTSELVVECYLEPGKPYRLLLTESVSYFDAPSMPKVSDAVVTITHKGLTDTLQYITYIAGSTDTTKVFNFISNKIVQADYTDPYLLNIVDKKGRKITGNTTLLPPTKIDTVQRLFDESDTLGYIITKIKDDPEKANFYRYVLLAETAGNTYSVQNLYFDEVLTFSNSALLKVNNEILIKSPNEFSSNSLRKSKHHIYLYHIEEAYYRFLKSVADARDANGNPFAQPPSIRSNVVGGKGIFTGLTVTNQTVISPE